MNTTNETLLCTGGLTRHAAVVAMGLVLCIEPVLAQCNVPAGIGGSGGLSTGIDVVGNYAYAVEHDRLTCFDIRDPAQPRPVGTVILSSNFLWDVKVGGGIAACADAFWGVRIVDVSNPEAPFYLSTYDTPYGPESVEVSGDIIYAADGNYSVQVIDISDPRAPTLRSSISTAFRYAQEVVIVGATLYIGSEAYGVVALQTADVSNPSTPVSLDTLVLSPGYPVGLSDLDVSGTTVYLSESNTGLHVIDATNPSDLQEIGTLPDQPTGAVRPFGSRLLLGRIAGLGGQPSLDVIDVSDPSTPSVVANVPLPGSADDITIVGNRAYVASYDAGITTLDLTNPDAPVVIAASGAANAASDVVALDGLAYVADGRFGLKVLSLDNPMVPAPVGALATPGTATGVHVAGTVAYLAAADAGLVTVDITDPAHPAMLGSLDTPGVAVEVTVTNDLAYIADGTQGLRIADVSDPANLQSLGSVLFPGVNAEATSVFIDGTWAYLTDRYYGLRVVDVTDPSAPVLRSTTDTYSYAYDVIVDGTYAYVSDYSKRVYVMDVSDPLVPTILWSGEPNSSGQKLALADGKLFLSQGQGGYLETYDVTNPAAPYLLSSVGAPTLGNGLSCWNGFVYVAHSYNGLRSFRIDGLPHVVGPQSSDICTGFDTRLYVAAAGQDAAGADPPSFQWRKDGAVLADGPTGTGSTIEGSATAALAVANASGADQGTFDCVVTNPCGDTISTAATLTVHDSGCCPGDFDGDFDLDLADLAQLVACLAGPGAPNPGCDPDSFALGDLDADSDLDLLDYAAFQSGFEGACVP